MPLPLPVAGRLEAYLNAVDASLRSLPEPAGGDHGYAVEGLYVVGSAALGDWGPNSDIDALAVSSVRADRVDVERLAAVHADRSKPFLDVGYVTWDDLATDPASVPAGPFSLGGRFLPYGHGPRVPVTWHTLARYGIALRGPEPAELPIWTDQAALAAWVSRNLSDYWAPRVARSSRLLGQYGLHSLSSWEVAWTVLGVSRLHYTLATGDITSKSGAGRYALTTFDPRWERIVQEALRIRVGSRGSRYLEPLRRRRDMLDFAEMVIEDAGRIA